MKNIEFKVGDFVISRPGHDFHYKLQEYGAMKVIETNENGIVTDKYPYLRNMRFIRIGDLRDLSKLDRLIFGIE